MAGICYVDRAYQLLPEWAVLATARFLPWFELAIGVLLLTGVWLRYVSIVAAAIGRLLCYNAALLRNGMGIDCGCFGVGEPLSAKTLARDGLLLASAITLAVLSKTRRIGLQPFTVVFGC